MKKMLRLNDVVFQRKYLFLSYSRRVGIDCFQTKTTNFQAGCSFDKPLLRSISPTFRVHFSMCTNCESNVLVGDRLFYQVLNSQMCILTTVRLPKHSIYLLEFFLLLNQNPAFSSWDFLLVFFAATSDSFRMWLMSSGKVGSVGLSSLLLPSHWGSGS